MLPVSDHIVQQPLSDKPTQKNDMSYSRSLPTKSQKKPSSLVALFAESAAVWPLKRKKFTSVEESLQLLHQKEEKRRPRKDAGLPPRTSVSLPSLPLNPSEDIFVSSMSKEPSPVNAFEVITLISNRIFPVNSLKKEKVIGTPKYGQFLDVLAPLYENIPQNPSPAPSSSDEDFNLTVDIDPKS